MSIVSHKAEIINLERLSYHTRTQINLKCHICSFELVYYNIKFLSLNPVINYKICTIIIIKVHNNCHNWIKKGNMLSLYIILKNIYIHIQNMKFLQTEPLLKMKLSLKKLNICLNLLINFYYNINISYLDIIKNL